MKEADTHESSESDKRAPMASAPMRYLPDGGVDWGNMWDTFCILAKEGGPPHRDTMLYAEEDSDTERERYNFAASEIVRGIREVIGLEAHATTPGWITVRCHSTAVARWLAEAIELENVQARCDGALLMVPVGESFTLKGEIKNVVTAVAKTTHYWREHIPSEVKNALKVEEQLIRLKGRIKGWLRRQPVR